MRKPSGKIMRSETDHVVIFQVGLVLLVAAAGRCGVCRRQLPPPTAAADGLPHLACGALSGSGAIADGLQRGGRRFDVGGGVPVPCARCFVTAQPIHPTAASFGLKGCRVSHPGFLYFTKPICRYLRQLLGEVVAQCLLPLPQGQGSQGVDFSFNECVNLFIKIKCPHTCARCSKNL